MDAFFQRAHDLANIIKDYSDAHVLVVSHYDADGLSAAAIASVALDRAFIQHEVRILKQLGPDDIEQLKQEKEHELIWFCDFGSGQFQSLNGLNFIITDHHVPDTEIGASADAGAGSGQRSLADFGGAIHEERQLNPHFFGFDGATDLSGAGATYFVAEALDKGNRDMSPIAIVGAIGDLQASHNCKLMSMNRLILGHAQTLGLVEIKNDVWFFGRETRQLQKFMQFSSDPEIPGVSGSREGAVAFLDEHGIHQREGDHWRVWVDLTENERLRLIDAMRVLLEKHGKDASRLIGESYVLVNELEGTALHDAKEFSTLLNSCGRHDREDIGVEVAKGNRKKALKQAFGLQSGHRRVLVQSMKVVEQVGINAMDYLQYFHGHALIKESVIGTVSGMILGSRKADDNIPLIGFADKGEDEIKVSGRSTRKLVELGLDLSAVMNKCAEALGGVGGGHAVAAGATIPAGTEEQFLKLANKMIGKQLASSSS